MEDEVELARPLVRGLREEGHAVDACETGADAMERVERLEYDVILLDWMLPDADGVTVLRGWRARGVRTPVMMLTARSAVGERVLGLRSGADDYLTKPFAFDELVARIEALHRRGAGEGPLRALNLELDGRRRALKFGTASVSLTAREFALCAEFMRCAGDVLTRSVLLASVWGVTFDGEPNIVEVYVGYLRRKLREVAADAVVIETVRGVGYRLTPQSPSPSG